MSAPYSLIQLVENWKHSNMPKQELISWPRANWVNTLPEYKALFNEFPELIGRDELVEYGKLAASSKEQAVKAFIIVMIWGFGRTGYGPYRTNLMLNTSEDADERLLNAACELKRGSLEGYEELAGPSRLHKLGPAFGTKYLHFCSHDSGNGSALILDALVSDWLKNNTELKLNPTNWSIRTYKKYLEQMNTWATELDIKVSDLEYCIFQAQANSKPGNQWQDQKHNL